MRLPWNIKKYLKKSESDCCAEHGCVSSPSTSPSVAPSADPTGPTHWYPDPNGARCIFGPVFESEDECCEEQVCGEVPVVEMFLLSSRNVAEQRCLHLLCALMMLVCARVGIVYS